MPDRAKSRPLRFPAFGRAYRRAFGRPSRLAYRTRLVSPLMRRVLLLNVLPLALLAVTFLFLDQFQNSLLEAEVTALREQAKVYAVALGQSAVSSIHGARARAFEGLGDGAGDTFLLNTELARPLLLRLTEPVPNAHARLFSPDGRIVADSRADKNHKSGSATSASAPTDDADFDESDPPEGLAERLYGHLLSWLPSRPGGRIVMNDPTLQVGADASPSGGGGQPPSSATSANSASVGADTVETPAYIRRSAHAHLIVTVAEPVIHDGHTVGVIQLTRQAREVDRSLFAVRSSILSLFLMALAITVFLSWYLSLTIARPLLRLVASTHVMRESSGRTDMVPEPILARRDEIGELARALRESALELWARMDAIERFAADVSHEIKNPLTSIRSAIETLLRVEKNEQPRKLLSIINDDVRRLDRLITDIADASRVDAELSRAKAEPVSVMPLLSALAEIHSATRSGDQPHFFVQGPEGVNGHPVQVFAVEDRLVQVLRNLIGNAISFSPPNGRILLGVDLSGSMVEMSVSDEGPGIPQAKLDSIFDRFYSERPQGENFGQHSGLGLSISRQIIDALRGTISAENRIDETGRILGARFIVKLPRVAQRQQT